MEAVCTDGDDAAACAGIDAALAMGANFTDENVRPVYFAAFGRRAAVVAHLIRRGAGIRTEWAECARRTSNPPGGKHGETALHVAAANGDVEILRLLLTEADGREYIDTFDYVGRTPLAVAACEGQLEAARVLIEAGADVNAHDAPRAGDTAISEAVMAGRPELVAFLLAAGADPTIPGWMWLTAIHRAQQAGSQGREMLQMMRERLGVSDGEWEKLLLKETGSGE